MEHSRIIAAVIVGVLSTARTARLLAWDAYPPMVWLRAKWDDKIGEDGWGKLLHCHFCMTPYIAVGVAGWWAIWPDSNAWWIVNGVWGLSYLAAILVSWDDGPGSS